MSKAIIILNSARSGSSLLAGILAKSGVFVSDNLMEANAFNPNGFFEDMTIRDLNTKVHNLCKVYDPSWNAAFSLPDGWLESKEINCVVYEELRDYIKNVYAVHELFFIKEPSIIRLMPLYDKIFRELNIIPYYLHLFRNPVEYMKDYKWAFPEVPETNILWNYVKYNIEAESFTRGRQRLFITFNQLYDTDKIEILKSIGNAFDIDYLKFNNAEILSLSTKNINEFFKPEIRRFKEIDNPINWAAMPNMFISQYAVTLYFAILNGRIENIVFDDIKNKTLRMENKFKMNNLGEKSIQIY